MRSSIAGIVSCVVIVGLLFGAAYYFATKEGPATPTVINPRDDDEIGTGAEISITAQHQYVGGTHTIAGEIELPTPCYRLTNEVIVRESFPEQVTVAFAAHEESGTVCAQVITAQRFKVAFDASESALITAMYNGESAVLNLVKVEAGGNLDPF
ncbi:MAG TPA: hypothetical protein VGA06_02240 [Candidatus Paceibacterota bacterium]|jgi:hypothetical protein